jgi:hypothetical protein
MESTTNINATIMPERSWNCQRLEGKHTALQIALDVDNYRYTRVAKTFKKWIELEVIIATTWCTALGSEVYKIPARIETSGKNHKHGVEHTRTHTMALYVKYLNDFL